MPWNTSGCLASTGASPWSSCILCLPRTPPKSVKAFLLWNSHHLRLLVQTWADSWCKQQEAQNCVYFIEFSKSCARHTNVFVFQRTQPWWIHCLCIFPSSSSSSRGYKTEGHAQGTSEFFFSLRIPRIPGVVADHHTIQKIFIEFVLNTDFQVDHWVEVHEMSGEDTAKVIHEHGIDIAIDLCGQADHPRLDTYSFRPAPVQISFLGYPGKPKNLPSLCLTSLGTTGAPFMDYFIGDPISTPVETMAPYFSEKLILMPHTYQVWCSNMGLCL